MWRNITAPLFHLWEGQLTLNAEITVRRKMDQCKIDVAVTGNFHMFSASDPLFEEYVKRNSLSTCPSKKEKWLQILKTFSHVKWKYGMNDRNVSIILLSWKATENRPGLYLFYESTQCSSYSARHGHLTPHELNKAEKWETKGRIRSRYQSPPKQRLAGNFQLLSISLTLRTVADKLGGNSNSRLHYTPAHGLRVSTL